MRRLTQSWRATLRRSYGTSQPNRGHSMSIDNIPVVEQSSSTFPILDAVTSMLGKQTERLEYAEPHKSPADLVRVAVIGYGYWGPNVVRNLYNLENCEVVSVCDKNTAVLKRASRQYP